MTSFFKRLINPGGQSPSQSGTPRLVLAAFGKHPGWNDHIPGIGLETEALAHLKQAMYVTGIGGRIDSGAWKTLDAEKRIEGFDHTFLCLQGNLVIAGRMNSSEDGLRRKEYPMVFCVEAEGFSPEMILTKVLPELERLRESCRATASAEQVTVECRMAQDRVREVLRQEMSSSAGTMISAETRRRFVEHPALGPERVGLLRILHELGDAGNPGGKSRTDARSHHVRLPLASESVRQAFLLWAGLLQGAVSASSPLLLISRYGTDWLDAIVGEPTSDDFFCLQAMPKALPLASQIPYDLPPELKPRWSQIEARFVGVEDSTSAMSQMKMAATANMPPHIAGSVESGTPPARKSFFGLIVLAGIVVLVAAVAGVWMVSGNRGSPPQSKPVQQTSSAPPKVAIATQPKPVEQTNKTGNAADAARIKVQQEEKSRADAEVKRLADARKIADDKAREEARQKTVLAEKAKASVEPAPTPVAPRNGDAKAQAKLRDEDAGLVQIAFSQGNYSRALEISKKWAGSESFKELLVQIEAETNLLSQLTQHLQAGNYSQILNSTNSFPDKAGFTEVRSKAVAEKKILDQASAEFDVGDYTFLQRPEVTALMTKPPFQKLIQDGGAEEGQLTKAKQLQTENKPQAASDLIGQSKLRKPPFVKIQQWASGELGRVEGEQRDSQSANGLFEKGEYGGALELCRKYSGIAAFDALTGRISEEKKILADAGKKFSDGDYSFISELSGRDYKTKPPFAELLRKGGEEVKTLGELEKLRQANGWEVLSGELNKLASDVIAKKPFADLRQWAQGKAREDEERKKTDPSWLDSEFEVLLVRFNIIRAKDAKWPEAKSEKPLDGFLDVQGTEFYLKKVTFLRDEYTKSGWLDQNDRLKKLNKLEDTIQNR